MSLSGFKKVFGFTMLVIMSLTCVSLYSTQPGRGEALGSINEDAKGKDTDKVGHGVARLPFMGYNSASHDLLALISQLRLTVYIHVGAFTYSVERILCEFYTFSMYRASLRVSNLGADNNAARLASALGLVRH